MEKASDIPYCCLKFVWDWILGWTRAGTCTIVMCIHTVCPLLMVHISNLKYLSLFDIITSTFTAIVVIVSEVFFAKHFYSMLNKAGQDSPELKRRKEWQLTFNIFIVICHVGDIARIIYTATAVGGFATSLTAYTYLLNVLDVVNMMESGIDIKDMQTQSIKSKQTTEKSTAPTV